MTQLLALKAKKIKKYNGMTQLLALKAKKLKLTPRGF